MNFLQEKILSTLQELIKILDDNDISYFMSSGTCLGTVRHGGFIPWDDDADICIKREDYNKLLAYIKTYKSDRYAFSDIDSPNYPFPFLKFYDKNISIIEGGINKEYEKTFIYVDIFPVDYISNNKLIQKYTILKCLFYKALIRVKIANVNKNPIIKFVFKFISKFYSLPKLKKKMNCLSTHKKTNFMMEIVWLNPGNKPFCSTHLDDFKIQKFENLNVKIPYNYDEYLTNMYGDYMKLPDVQDRDIHGIEIVNIKDDK